MRFPGNLYGLAMSLSSKTPQRKTSVSTVVKRSRGRPRLEDSAAIDDALLAVALKEFLQQGYGGASMSRIAKTAGMSKATLYLRYASKDELFRAIMHQQIERIAPAKLLVTRSGLPELEDGLRAYANRMLQTSFEGEMLGINRLIYSESHRFPELGAAANERNRLGIRRIAEFIRERARLDEIPCHDAELVAEAYICMIRGWYISHMLSDHAVAAAQRGKWVKRATRTLVAGRREW